MALLMQRGRVEVAMPEALEGLRELVRRLHVHYDVEPELELRDGARVKVALLVRIWGVHAKGARALPGCTKCHELLSLLEQVAAFAFEDELSSGQVGVEPFRPALYDSRVVPGTDEVALTVRIAGDRSVRDRGESGEEERALKLVRARLKALGIPER
jgi:hypothetical protein